MATEMPCNRATFARNASFGVAQGMSPPARGRELKQEMRQTQLRVMTSVEAARRVIANVHENYVRIAREIKAIEAAIDSYQRRKALEGDQ